MRTLSVFQPYNRRIGASRCALILAVSTDDLGGDALCMLNSSLFPVSTGFSTALGTVLHHAHHLRCDGSILLVGWATS